MKKELMDAFSDVMMPEECEASIRRALEEGKSPRRSTVRRLSTAAAALAVALVMLFSLSTEVRAAVNNIIVKYFFPGSDITVYEEINEDGNAVGITAVVDTEAPPFARIVNDRLYFTGNGEKIDITDQIREEEPFYYSYVDDYGLTHYMAVGYSGSLENFGIYEFIREVEDGQQPWEGWVTGSGRNFLDEDDMAYPWVDAVWEDLNIPWPKPE